MATPSQKTSQDQAPTEVKRSSNIESWRKGAAQIVVVRRLRGGGVRGDMIATCATPDATLIIINELAKTRTSDELIYAFAPDERSAIAPKEALRRAIDDFLLGGQKGIPGKLIK